MYKAEECRNTVPPALPRKRPVHRGVHTNVVRHQCDAAIALHARLLRHPLFREKIRNRFHCRRHCLAKVVNLQMGNDHFVQYAPGSFV